MSSDPIGEVLGPGGSLERAIPAYEHRPQQLALARRIWDALTERRYVLAEAGTGTGKTLAYLVPALLSGRKVVVSTATKALQEQIFFKDVPLLARALGRPIRAAYMKGRANYLCKARFEEFARAPTFASRDDGARWPGLVSWAEATSTGDRAELMLPETFAPWRELSATAETCTGQRCPAYEACFVTKMRREAAEAELVVVNHHLLFADLALRTRSEEGFGAEVIPRYEAIVFDEAHALEEVATEHFGVQVSSFRIEELCRDGGKAATKAPDLGPDLAPLLSRLEGKGANFFAAALSAVGLSPTRGPRGPRGGGDGTVRLARGALEGVTLDLHELLDTLAAVVEKAAEAKDVPELLAVARRANDLERDLAFVADVGPGKAWVHFAERRGRGSFLRAAPVEVGPELSKRLYRTVDTAVFTSATLAVGGGFRFLRDRLGLTGGDDAPEVDELAVGSPFDFETQAALYLPRHLPEPADPSFLDAAAREIEALVAVTGGRAFALFTSIRNMQLAHQALAGRLPYRVLLQGELPKHELLDRFREKPSVLFATASFWEGVDVPGDALSLVIIDKLPFAAPNDPVVAARIEALEERGRDPFDDFQVPRAAITLRQGFGRLIRTRSDRGVVAILDRRIVTRGYGRAFLRALPPCPRFSSVEEVEGFWERVGSAAS